MWVLRGVHLNRIISLGKHPGPISGLTNVNALLFPPLLPPALSQVNLALTWVSIILQIRRSGSVVMVLT